MLPRDGQSSFLTSEQFATYNVVAFIRDVGTKIDSYFLDVAKSLNLYKNGLVRPTTEQ